MPGDEYVVTGNHTFTARWKGKGRHNFAGPATGDDSKVELWLAIMVMSILVVIGCFKYRKTSRHVDSK